jgi:hypothetical protein
MSAIDFIALTRPSVTLSPRGEGRALPSPFREKVAIGRMRGRLESFEL